MGCQYTKQQNKEIVEIESEEQFKLSYKQLVTQDRGDVFNLYHFTCVLNRSNYSIVRKVVSQASKQTRVCKIVPLKDKKYFKVVSQTQFLKKLDHPNIVQIIEYFLQPSFLYMILQEIPGSKVLSQIYNAKNGILFEDIIDIMEQILRAVDFCHRKMIVHRAITTENIMLFWNQNSKPCVKLIDFSQACTLNSDHFTSVTPGKRNINLKQVQIHCSDKIDIFDCGIVLFSLLSGRRIVNKNAEVDFSQILQDSINTIKQLRLGKKIQKQIINLLSLMLKQDPKARPSASECLNHQFFKYCSKNNASKKALSNLFTFQAQNNLKYIFSMYASQNMTTAMEKTQYLTQFYNLDSNKDGEIQMQELVQGIQNNYNIEKQKAKYYAQQMFNNLDKNKSGSINFSEFITGTLKISKLISLQFLQKMFKQIDVNADGYITQQQINSIITGIDRHNIMDGKKQLNFQQFKSIILKMLQFQRNNQIQIQQKK